MAPAPAGQPRPLVAKRLALDLIPALPAGGRVLADKPEGLAVSGRGRLVAAIDNDGLEDAPASRSSSASGAPAADPPATATGASPAGFGAVADRVLARCDAAGASEERVRWPRRWSRPPARCSARAGGGCWWSWSRSR